MQPLKISISCACFSAVKTSSDFSTESADIHVARLPLKSAKKMSHNSECDAKANQEKKWQHCRCTFRGYPTRSLLSGAGLSGQQKGEHRLEFHDCARLRD